MGKQVWRISEDILIVDVGSARGRERYIYEHYHPEDSVFRGDLLCQISLSKSQFKAVLAVLKDLGVEVRYLGER